MSKVKIQGNASGTGVLTVTAPNTSTDRTITLPDSTGTLLDENSSVPAANLTGTVADARISALTASKLTGALPAISGASLTGLPEQGLVSRQIFTSSGTWTKPSGITKVKVTCTGSGGGGGSQGQGGGAGGTAILFALDVTSISSVTVTVGAAVSGAGGSNNGTDGNTSSFGSHCSATGGEGGHNGSSRDGCAAGGEATGGDLNLGGSAGGTHRASAGGASYFGGGNERGSQLSYGSGSGGGAGGIASIGTLSGVVIVEEYK